jgi:D-serine dehydratase
VNQERLRELDRRPVSWRDKGFPDVDGVTVATLGAQGWNVLAGDLPFPVMVIKDHAVEHNLTTMAHWCDEHGVSIAPHGKTAMAPQLVARQLSHGAWGVTAATTTQARIFQEFGATRIIVANEVVDPAGMAWLARSLDSDLEVYTLVDSVASVQRLDAALAKVARPLPVLIELGAAGKRAGARTLAEACQIANAAAAAEHLVVAGVEAYEAVLGADDRLETLASIDALMSELVELATALAEDGVFEGRDEVLVTAGGSSYFDRVADALTGLDLGIPVRPVVRSGCYVVHDDGKYHRLSPLDGRSAGGPRLHAALEVWSIVLSRPEPGLAVLGMGKRDVSHDLSLPTPHAVHGPAGRREIDGEIEIVKLYDQHAVARLDSADPLAVGDLVASGIDHPCTAFDKWRLLPVVDDDYSVVGGIVTFF